MSDEAGQERRAARRSKAMYRASQDARAKLRGAVAALLTCPVEDLHDSTRAALALVLDWSDCVDAQGRAEIVAALASRGAGRG